jgi:hypothetical protein
MKLTILRINLLTHRLPQRIQPFCRTMQRIQIPIDFIFHLVVLGVGFELVFRAIGKRALFGATGHALQVAVYAFVARGRVPGRFAGRVALVAFAAVGVHAGCVRLVGWEGSGAYIFRSRSSRRDEEVKGLATCTANMDLLSAAIIQYRT